jgi:hypothetical protein
MINYTSRQPVHLHGYLILYVSLINLKYIINFNYYEYEILLLKHILHVSNKGNLQIFYFAVLQIGIGRDIWIMDASIERNERLFTKI